MAAWLPPVAACAGGGCLASAVQPGSPAPSWGAPGSPSPGWTGKITGACGTGGAGWRGSTAWTAGPGPLRRAGEVRPASWRTVPVYRI